MPQGSVLVALLFLIYINDSCKCVKYSESYHSADDTNILQSHSSLETLAKRINLDLKNLSQWLKTNKLSLNVTKTEFIIFHSMKINKQQDFSILHLNISSISVHIDDLRAFLNLVNHKFGIICISEKRISAKHPQTTNIDLPGSNIKQTPSESSAGGTLIYISQYLSYKLEKISRYTELKN